jgi:hypothetical protein
MSLIAHLAAHALAAGGPGHGVAATQGPQVPDPPPAPPPGFTGPVDVILGWIKWGAIVAGSVGMSACGLMMILGRRNRSSLAVDGAAGIPYVLLGLMVVSAGSAIAGVFL